ncbi:hypothetical protein I6A60_35075 [Frankia sp. AgB1.9]|uniref:hypothetical protein n=1 Tax=unclassified Frankia TaxID=2632575 RepID=UPI001933D943|nr:MULTISPECIES: hypothetical protein [unclassified Frankia]MBL7493740.1 hypothetical protein [Frankia sp. AgW1.1]MBL7553035.1 hypothetical protein [Frankia sp. AgB1.9]MBL7620513.1 hypothetical protein [Frankia sp. AgB1.8]
MTVDVPVLPRLEGDGVVLARSPWTKDRDEGGPKPIALLWLHRSYLIRFALHFATECPQVETIVIWPLGVAPELSAAAFAVGRALGARRPVGGPPLVTCRVRPPMRRTRPAVQDKVTADVNDLTYELIVWELAVPAAVQPAVGTARSEATQAAA